MKGLVGLLNANTGLSGPKGWGGKIVAVDAWYMEWTDTAGGFYRNRFYVNHGGNGTPVVDSIQHASNAGLLQHSSGQVVFDTNAPVDQQYPTIMQIAQLLFSCADGSAVQIIIPAPQSSIFLADNLRVDPAAVVTLIANVIAVVTNNLGSAVIVYRQGSLVNRRKDQP